MSSYIIRLPEVSRRTGRSRAAIYVDMDKGLFPKSVKIGERAIGWFEHEIEAWIKARLHRRLPHETA
ncbi:MAG: AlpA family phage regulatory protein [Micavibrio sp.]|nr:AlpA family phage regulatory protein [Micavibrio sp.]MBK9562986.1 AlpA family phage regulatory protein [Micavibrio sp.]